MHHSQLVSMVLSGRGRQKSQSHMICYSAGFEEEERRQTGVKKFRGLSKLEKSKTNFALKHLKKCNTADTLL
jgi:hypothetical protein